MNYLLQLLLCHCLLSAPLCWVHHPPCKHCSLRVSTAGHEVLIWFTGGKPQLSLVYKQEIQQLCMCFFFFNLTNQSHGWRALPSSSLCGHSPLCLFLFGSRRSWSSSAVGCGFTSVSRFASLQGLKRWNLKSCMKERLNTCVTLEREYYLFPCSVPEPHVATRAARVLSEVYLVGRKGRRTKMPTAQCKACCVKFAGSVGCLQKWVVSTDRREEIRMRNGASGLFSKNMVRVYFVITRYVIVERKSSSC